MTWGVIWMGFLPTEQSSNLWHKAQLAFEEMYVTGKATLAEIIPCYLQERFTSP